MNCPSRVDADLENDGHNQNPPAFAADLTTNNDLNHIANSREQRDHRLDDTDTTCADRIPNDHGKTCDETDDLRNHNVQGGETPEHTTPAAKDEKTEKAWSAPATTVHACNGHGGGSGGSWRRCSEIFTKTLDVLKKFAKFIGPGFMVSVAYIDPGNYATDVAAGASFRFRLLFVILMSNIFAIFLQSLCVKLGTITGMNLAENCKAHLPRWLNIVLYVFAEAAIIATDIAEVIGTAIALNLLIHVPLVAGCAISIVDVLIILIFYHPSGSIRGLRAFEIFVMLLVLGVVVCFCIQLSLIKNTSAGEVFKGFLPSSALVKSQGLYQSCGILGATVMPHSLYLGSGVVQARLKEFDTVNNNISLAESDSDDDAADLPKYRPSLAAIQSCLTFSVVELALSLFTFALFVNSAILITAGASLYNTPNASNADLFGIHDLLSKSLAPAAGTIFALALLLSGTSAGIVCTIAGQMVSEGQLSWSVKPWVRRLITRSISITPSIIIAGAVGKAGLSTALEASQVVLSVILPFVSAPLIYFTCRNKFMTVVAERIEPAGNNRANAAGNGATEVAAARVDAVEGGRVVVEGVQMRNSWLVAVFAALIWGVIVIMNVALLVLVGSGKE